MLLLTHNLEEDMDFLKEMLKQFEEDYKKEQKREELALRKEIAENATKIAIMKEEMVKAGLSEEFVESLILEVVKNQCGGN